MIGEDTINQEDLKKVTFFNNSFYYAKVKGKYGSYTQVLDNALNEVKVIHSKSEKEVLAEIEKMSKHMFGLTDSFKGLVFNEVAHADYYEEAMGKVCSKGYPGFPVQRRGSMKDLFYNTENSLFKKDIFELIQMCHDKKEFNISFKSILNSKKYVLHSFQFVEDNKIKVPSCFFFVKKELYEKHKNKIINLFEKSDSCYNDYYLKEEYEKDAMFVITTTDVTNALDALFDGNKHLLRGYQNKKIKIS